MIASKKAGSLLAYLLIIIAALEASAVNNPGSGATIRIAEQSSGMPSQSSANTDDAEVFLVALQKAIAADDRRKVVSMIRYPNRKGIKIWLIDNSNGQYKGGCGCTFWPVSRQPGFDDSWKQKAYLVGNYDKQAWMNIDGEIVELRLVKDTSRYKGRKGDRYFQTYRYGNITIIVKCVATGFGDTHAVYCDSTITVIKGTRKQTVKAKGDCGC